MIKVNNNAVALYIRVSTEEQVDGYSLEAQQDALLQYCKLMNYSVYKIFIDAGRSGKSIAGRPSFQELLRELPTGNFTKVLCLRLNRLARNLPDLLYAVEQFEQYGISLLSITEKLPTDNAMNKFILQMIGAAAQLEREQITQNTKLGMQERSKQGKWNSGNQVLGYHWHTHPIQGKLSYVEIIPDEAALVRNIFQRYAQGSGLKAITNWLNQSGYRTKRGKAFYCVGVRKILSNPNYIGKITYTVDETSKVKKVVDGEHEAIIDLTLWHAVQSQLSDRSSITSKTVDRYSFLSGLLKCPACGHSMIPAHVKRKRKHGQIKTSYYYVCSRYRSSGSAICLPHAIPASSIENWVKDQLQLVLTQPAIVNKLVTEISQRHDKKVAPLKQHIQQIEKELQALNSRRNRCFELFEDGHYNELELQERLEKIKTEQAQHETILTQLKQQLTEYPELKISAGSIQQTLQSVHVLLESATPEQQQSLFHSLIDKISIASDRDITKSIIYSKSSLFNLPITAQTKGES